MQYISRDDARAAGLKRYYEGQLCRHGHDDERMVSNGGCVECNRIRAQDTYTRNKYAAHMKATAITAPPHIHGYVEALVRKAMLVPPHWLQRVQQDGELNLWCDGLWVGKFATQDDLEIHKWNWLISQLQK